ncbi:protein-tyrosine phosphatase-like protein [Aspergillus keveii]|jgi:atypical dual specificity phosphatase|uniref:protein-tyrosine-phosphatase n=1 Tax=Aspergillus keveii TaxID=714993 RepID=A0ABR4G3B4_9EURO
MGKSKPPSNGCILPSFLYVAPASAASSLQFLQKHEITIIISIGKTPSHRHTSIETEHGPRSIIYHRLSLEDKEDARITKCVEAACIIIDEASASNRRVLVHCSAAISRSPAVVAGYLIRRRGYSLDAALEALRKVRPVVSPNRGFIEQLKRIEMEASEGRAVSHGEVEG